MKLRLLPDNPQKPRPPCPLTLSHPRLIFPSQESISCSRLSCDRPHKGRYLLLLLIPGQESDIHIKLGIRAADDDSPKEFNALWDYMKFFKAHRQVAEQNVLAVPAIPLLDQGACSAGCIGSGGNTDAGPEFLAQRHGKACFSYNPGHNPLSLAHVPEPFSGGLVCLYYA